MEGAGRLGIMPRLLRRRIDHRAAKLEPGEWRLTRSLGGVLVACPQCGARLGILFDEVLADGQVTNRLECPTGDCSWHEFAKLDGWGMN